MRSGGAFLTALSLLALTSAAGGDLILGDRILVDSGDPTPEMMVASPDGEGRYWNFLPNDHGEAGRGPIGVVDTSGEVEDGVSMYLPRIWTCPRIFDRTPSDPAMPYPYEACYDTKQWGPGNQGDIIQISGLPTDLLLDVTFYATYSSATDLDQGTVIYTIGTDSAELDPVDNIAGTVTISSVGPDASGQIVVNIVGGTPAEPGGGTPIAVWSVMDIEVVPEPACLLILAAGVAALKRTRKPCLRR